MKKNQKSLRKTVASSATRRTRRQTLLSALPELLESRTLMSTYCVTTTADSGAGSLRAAIANVDADSSPDTITFNIGGGGMQSIYLDSALPAITNTVTIQGTTQPGYSGTPLIELNGSNASGAGLDFEAGSGGSQVLGLTIDSFSGAGVVLNSGGVTLQGNYIGTDPTGSYAEGNSDGVDITSNDNLLNDNLISGNNYNGVSVSGDGNTLTGNLIGPDVTGTQDIGNSVDGSMSGSGGVYVIDATNTTIGGTTPAARNVLSGNYEGGVVFVDDSGPGNVVEGNYIGVDATGEAAMGNYDAGVDLGTTDGDPVCDVSILDNVISANFYSGIYLNAAMNNTIQGNLIGTDAAGHETLEPYSNIFTVFGNENDGITIDVGSTGNLIGGTTAASRNVIAGNYSNGVDVVGVSASGNQVEGNFIGTDISGQTAAANIGDGILVDAGQLDIGGTQAGAGNVISGNDGDGVDLEGGTSIVYGNLIGLAADGSSSLGNGGDGIRINNSSGNVIGGIAAGEANVIADNGTTGPGRGVNVISGLKNDIEGNSIYGNTAIGIDLGSDGVTANDSQTRTSNSPNDYQDFPVIGSMTFTATTVTLDGTLPNAAGMQYEIDLYNNPADDPSGHGQGQTFVGADLVTVNSDGSFTATFTVGQLPSGVSWSATATNKQQGTQFGNTSEFSADYDLTATVQKQDAQVQLSSSLNPATFGQSMTFTATVTGSGAQPTGSVTFFDNGNALGTVNLSGDSATFTTSSLSVAAHSISATYSGDSNYNQGSVSLTETVNALATTTALSVNPTTSFYGQNVTLTATISPSTANGVAATGTVTFLDGASVIGTASLTSGTASITVNTLGIGTHNLTAQYGGDSNFAASSSTASETVQVQSTTSLSVSTPSSTLGQAVTLTATVTPSINGVFPSGTVTFLDSGTALGTASLNSSGVATLSVSTLPVGTDSLVAQYGGNTNFLPSSGTASETVTKAATGTSLVASPTPSTFGQMVTFTATVTPSSSNLTPSGSVSFMDGSNSLGTATLVNGVASLQVSTLAVGGHTITANYGGDSNFTGSSGMASENVNQAASNTALSLSSASSTFGQAVTLTATVTPEINGVFPSGTITFSSGATTLGTVTLNSSGVATVSVNSLPVGSDALVAQYSGDTNFLSSSGSSSETVSKANSSTALAVSTPSSTLGQSVTLTATVTPEINGFFPTGTVTFSSGGTTLGTVSLNSSGVATVSVSTLPVGSDALAAQYNGDPNFLTSSGAATETVNKAGTSMLLVASPATSTFGQMVTLTATVTPSSSSLTPSGSVSFMDGSNSLGTVALVNGVASLQVSTLTVSSHTITANYGGDPNFTPSSATASETVGKAASSTAVSVSVPSSTLGQSVTLTATVTPSINGVFPTGLVTFTSGGTTLGSASLNANGVATLAISSLPVGTDPLAAQYAGDNNFMASSGTASESVNKAGTGTSLVASPATTTFGRMVTLTATVTPSSSSFMPSGSVSFMDGANSLGTATLTNGVASLQVSTLAVGGHTITANYGGDSNFLASSGTASESVGQAASSTALAVSMSSSTLGQSVTLTATVTPEINGIFPTGTITFSSGGTALGQASLNASGVATMTVSSMPVGSDALVAQYSGDANFLASSGSASETVNKANTGTSLSETPASTTAGQTVTLTATVTPAVSGYVATGSVTFWDGSNSLGSVSLNASDVATLQTSTLAIGGHTITAVYGGDGNFTGSTSNSVTENVSAAPSSITGTVSNDLTGNGFSSDDTPLAGWTVDLFLNGATTPSQTAVTGSNGIYTFSNLVPGSYSVQEVLQSGWTETGGSAGYPLTAISGNNFTGVNFDNFKNVSIGGTVEKDLTGNGFSSDDTAMSGVTVNLFSVVNGVSTTVASTTSGSNGTYSFANVGPGTYSVQEVVPAGYTLTGGAGGYQLTAASGQNVSTENFDNYLPPAPPPPPPSGSISGYVFCDDNLDGVFDLTTWDGNVVSESGEAGATLTLTGTTTSGASVSLTTQSVTGGYYTFAGLAAGTYTVSLTGFSPNHQAELSHGSVNPTYSTKVTLTSGQALTGPAEGQNGASGTTSGLDFAEIAPGGLEGFVWDDTNNDGNIDYNEAGIVNVTIQLSGVTYTGAKVSETTVTDNNGEYIFMNLTPGTYTLSEVTPNGFTDGKDSVGSLGGAEYFSSNCGSSSGCSTGSTCSGSNCGNSSCGQSNCGSNCNNSCGSCCINDCYSNCGYNCFTNYSTNCYNGNCGNCGGNSQNCNSQCNCGWSSGCNSTQNAFSSIQIGGCENVGINYNFGEHSQALSTGSSGCCGNSCQTTDTATLAFWHNSQGQALLCSLNGGPNATALGNWLATMFPNMYGSSAKIDFAGMTNSQIAAFYNSNDFNVTGVKLDAAVLSAALSSYVTNTTWAGGSYATKYGFTVSAQGVGYDTVSVGSDGVAFGVANNSTVTILQALDATDQQAVDGDLYNGNTTLRSDAYTIYAAIAQNGLST